jgi:ATP-dependent Clp protease adaptor protein ClpS
MSNTTTITKPKVNSQIKEPNLFKVVYVNDEKTTMEFVVESLMIVFNYTQEASEHITMEIHETGSSVVAILPFELAEQKGLEVTTMARNQGFPLQVKVEEEQ